MLKQSLNPRRSDRFPASGSARRHSPIMQIKAKVLALVALALVTLTSSPAFARIYSYRLNPANGAAGTLTIDTRSGAGSINLPRNLIIQFTSDDLKKFAGNLAKFTATLNPDSVHYTTYNRKGKAVNNVAGPGQTFSLAFKNNQLQLIASSYFIKDGYGSKKVPGWTSTANISTAVPAPDSALLFGLGLLGLFSLRRFGLRGQAMAKPKRGGLVPA